MSDQDKGAFDRWLTPILLGLTAWGWAVGTGLIVLIGAEDSYGSVTDLAISFVLSLWILYTTDPKTRRQLALVVAVGAGAIALSVMANVGLFALSHKLGIIWETGYVVGLGSGARALSGVLCFGLGVAGSKWICDRLGVPRRSPGSGEKAV